MQLIYNRDANSGLSDVVGFQKWAGKLYFNNILMITYCSLLVSQKVFLNGTESDWILLKMQAKLLKIVVYFLFVHDRRCHRDTTQNQHRDF